MAFPLIMVRISCGSSEPKGTAYKSYAPVKPTVTISILANTVRPSVHRRSDDTAFRAETFSWQDPVHSWKAGPGEIMTGKFIYLLNPLWFA